MITLNGIKTCDTVRKARRWLDQQDIAHQFRDFRESPPSASELHDWLKTVDWQVLLNKRSTSWKALSEAHRVAICDAEAAVVALLANPTLIKRPVLSNGHAIHLGFTVEKYQALLEGAFFERSSLSNTAPSNTAPSDASSFDKNQGNHAP